MIRKTIIALMIAMVAQTSIVFSSSESFLGWASAVIQCGRTPNTGDISCAIKTGPEGYNEFVIHAFDKRHELNQDELNKLKEFPLSSLQITHEPGYELLGGYTIYFKLNRVAYNADKEPISELICVSVNKKGVKVSDKLIRKEGQQAASSNR